MKGGNSIRKIFEISVQAENATEQVARKLIDELIENAAKELATELPTNNQKPHISIDVETKNEYNSINFGREFYGSVSQSVVDERLVKHPIYRFLSASIGARNIHPYKFHQMMTEGIRVIIHSEMQHEVRKVRRFSCIMFFDQETLDLCFFELTDDGEFKEKLERIHVPGIQFVCIGACSTVLRDSLEHMNGHFYAHDSIDQANRCISLLLFNKNFHIEIQPTTKQVREELAAAQRVALGVARVLEIISSTCREQHHIRQVPLTYFRGVLLPEIFSSANH